MAAITYYALLARTQAEDKQTDTQMRQICTCAYVFLCLFMWVCYWAAHARRERDERRREETGALERKDRRANLPGLLLVRQISYRWGGSRGER